MATIISERNSGQATTTTMLAEPSIHNATHPLNIDSLLQIFKFLQLKDCFNCSQVCRIWHEAISKHFRIQKRLTITYFETNHLADTEESILDSISIRRNHHRLQLHTIQNDILLNYPDFVRILSQFPSVKKLTFYKHPVNDILLSAIVLQLPALKEIHFNSCWVHPSMLQHNSVYYRRRPSPLAAIFSHIIPNDSESSNQPENEYRFWSDYLLEIAESRIETTGPASPKWLDRIWLNIHQVGQSNDVITKTGSYQDEPNLFNLYAQPQLSRSGFEILAGAYKMITHLTLANCGLTDDTASIVIQSLQQIKYLDISDNDEVEGLCLRHIPDTCQTFKAGTFNTRVSIVEFLSEIVRSPAKTKLINLELIGCLFENLHHLEQMTQLTSLKLRFFCSNPMVRVIAPFVSIASLTRLRTLVLEQQYCNQEMSAIGHRSFCAIVRQCTQLERLEILGEWGWELRLDDCSLQALATNALNLRRFTLTGNSTKITDKGVEWLARLSKLRQLRLTSFESITDHSIAKLLCKLRYLNRLCLRGNRLLTVKTMDACVQTSFANPERFLEVKFDEWQMSASRLFLKHASNYIRNTWCNRIELFISGWNSNDNNHHRHNINDDQPSNNNSSSSASHDNDNNSISNQNDKPSKMGYESTFDNARSQHGNRNGSNDWPKNLNIILDRNLRQYQYDGNELTPGKLLVVFLSSIIVISMMVATLGLVIILPAGMTILLLYEKFIDSFLLILTPYTQTLD